MPPTVVTNSFPLTRKANVPAAPEKRNSNPAVVLVNVSELVSLTIRADWLLLVLLLRRLTHAMIVKLVAPARESYELDVSTAGVVDPEPVLRRLMLYPQFTLAGGKAE